MANKNFLLLSMEDTKIKTVSNVISNESCRKILDYLADKESSESEISEKLKLPISTVHYNLQQLMEAGLVSADEFHYSKKGKEISHYKLANKYIIIAPKSTYGIKEKLKSLLPVALISIGAAFVLQFASKYLYPAPELTPAPMILAKSAVVDTIAQSAATAEPAAGALRSMASQNATNAAQPAMDALNQAAPLGQQLVQNTFPNIALWFLAGAVFALAVHFVVGIFRKNSRQ
ncbi:MAG TPA: helix-turn-helix domain-containing protein [Candidatus Nanoarchaeia archaeon]|nr:helix-turn-helix domain-containing protein [Candidatus Nanoarchaeia archaeon]